MKIAVISDIHANLPALEAVWKSIRGHQPDNVFCLGDLVNFAGWDNEVVEFIRSRDITCIQGNHDEGIGGNKPDFPFSFANEAQRSFGLASIKRVNKAITAGNRMYLANLPFMLQLEFRFPFHPFRIAMVHGSTASNNEYITEDLPDTYFMEMMDAVRADLLLMGHTHVPFHKPVYCEEENRKIYRHAVNAGSVGKPKHGDDRSCYCLIEINHRTDLSDPSSIHVHYEYIPYDVRRVVRHIREMGLSDAYDAYLLKG